MVAMVKQMAEQRYRYKGPPPDVAAPLAQLSSLLGSTVAADSSKLCEAGADEFYPYGPEADCAARYVRQAGSGFRNGMRSVFAGLKDQGKIGAARELAPYVVDLIVAKTGGGPLVSPSEAKDIVAKEFAAGTGMLPGAPPSGPFGPAPIDASRMPAGIQPTPLPQWPGLPGTQATPVPMPGIPEGFPNGLTPLEEGDEGVEQPTAAEDEVPWLLIGVGAAVIVGGGIFLMTRKKK